MSCPMQEGHPLSFPQPQLGLWFVSAWVSMTSLLPLGFASLYDTRVSCLYPLLLVSSPVFRRFQLFQTNGWGGGTFPLIEVITTQREGVVHMDVDTMASNWDLSGLVTWEVLVYEVN